MFSLFGGKKSAKAGSVVAADVGATLQPADAFPGSAASSAQGAFGNCSRAAVAGAPPAAHFVPSVIPGEAASAFRVQGLAGLPPLVVLNTLVAPKRFEVWDMDSGATAFVRRRAAEFVAEPGDWIAQRVVDVACLPNNRLMLVVTFVGGSDLRILYRFDAARNVFARIGPVEHFTDDPDAYFEARPLAANAAVLRYDTDQVRLAPERYANTRSHWQLFSARHPDGIEVLNLGIDDGSVRRWAVVGTTLWLELFDPRDAASTPAKFKTLDLSKVL